MDSLSLRTDGARGHVEVVSTDGKTVLPATTSGAYTLDVAGLNGAAITIDGGLGPLDFTGWDAAVAGVFSRQTIRVDVIQDATGGHVFDWAATEGAWRETLGDLSTTAGDTVVSFDVVTLDGGASLSLEPVGVEYVNNCTYAQVINPTLPAVTAGGQLELIHGLSLVGSVILVDTVTGLASPVTPWGHTNPSDPSSPVFINFAAAHDAGDFTARITGMSPVPCALEVDVSEWYSLVLPVNASSGVSPLVEWAGPADSVQWIWGDGSAAETPVTTVALAHTYAPVFSGSATLRYRKGSEITRIESLGDNWQADLSVFQRLSELTHLQMFNTDLVGNISNLLDLTNLQILDLSLTQVTGDISNIAGATGITNLRLVNLANVVGNIAALSGMTGMTLLQAANSGLSGDIGALTTLPALSNVQLSNTGVSGDVAQLATNTSLVTVQIPNAQLTGDIGAMALTNPVTRLEVNANAGITGDMADLAGRTNMISLNLGGTAVSGDISNLAGMTAATTLNLDSTNVTGDIATLATMSSLTSAIVEGTAITGDPAAFVAGTPNLRTFHFQNMTTPPTAPQLDAVIATLAAGTVSTGRLEIGLTNPPITNTAGVATLQGRGWTVIHN